jgi:hypothetical protein
MEMITINFIKISDDGKYSFSDALHLPIDHTFTDEEIEAMKQQRFDNWLAHILYVPPEEQTPTKNKRQQE